MELARHIAAGAIGTMLGVVLFMLLAGIALIA